jgi:uncharacterized protein|tara:strand:+ start:1958 stop:3103 length:1146 start_codon:yes stop_codon:yes gene_type:complete
MFKGSKFHLSVELLEIHIRGYIESQPVGCQEVSFAWQGGEPTLLGLEYFRKIVALQEKYRRPGMHITNALQTNGTRLDSQWCEFLKEFEFLVGISIDGPEKFHNRYRKTKGGKGSYHLVKQGLDNLVKHGVEFNVLTVVQRHNADHPLEVYRGLTELGTQHLQFIPVVERSGKNGASERSVLPNQYGRFMISIFDEWLINDVGKIYIQQFESALNSAMGHVATICVHARECGRALALEHNGDVFACDHFVFDEYRIGNLQQQSYAEIVDGEDQMSFGHAKEKELTDRCRRCEIRDYCNGGCPAHQFIRFQNEEFEHNYLCEGYLDFFKHVQPYLNAMVQALKNKLPATQYYRFLADKKLRAGRNSPCPCGSGKKYKKCCGG